MTKSLPTINPVSDNDIHNIEQASEIFTTLFPEMGSRMGEVLQIMTYLEETRVNPMILPRVIRGVHNLIIGTGQGQLILHVKGEQVNIQVRETDEDINTKITKVIDRDYEEFVKHGKSDIFENFIKKDFDKIRKGGE